MIHANLCSGIGGWEIAADWMGWETVFQCEKDPFCKRILKYYWPNACLFDDLETSDFTPYAGKVDVLSMSTPCQPFSLAGQRSGINDKRYLWPHGLRAVREIKPRWVVFENVRGFANWSKGMVFEQVCADLESEKYEVVPFVLPASGVNAPHRRDRVFIIAYAECRGTSFPSFNRRMGWQGKSIQEALSDTDIYGSGTPKFGKPEQKKSNSTGKESKQWFRPISYGISSQDVTPDSHNKGLAQHGSIQRNDEPKQPPTIGNYRRVIIDTECTGFSRSEQPGNEKRFKPGYWDNWPQTEPLFRPGNDGIPSGLDGITLSKWRNESIKAAGNAVVPQLVYQIFKAIEFYELTN